MITTLVAMVMGQLGWGWFRTQHQRADVGRVADGAPGGGRDGSIGRIERIGGPGWSGGPEGWGVEGTGGVRVEGTRGAGVSFPY